MKDIKNNSDHICYFCKKHIEDDEMTVDHLTPLSKGGKHEEKNMVVCCEKCNSEKGDMTETEYISYLMHVPVWLPVSKIKIPWIFQQTEVNPNKIEKAKNYYIANQKFDKPLKLKTPKSNLLIDGYSKYISALLLGVEKVSVVYCNN